MEIDYLLVDAEGDPINKKLFNSGLAIPVQVVGIVLDNYGRTFVLEYLHGSSDDGILRFVPNP